MLLLVVDVVIGVFNVVATVTITGIVETIGFDNEYDFDYGSFL